MKTFTKHDVADLSYQYGKNKNGQEWDQINFFWGNENMKGHNDHISSALHSKNGIQENPEKK